MTDGVLAISGEHIKIEHSAYVRWLKVGSSYEIEWRPIGSYGYPPAFHAECDTEDECKAIVARAIAEKGAWDNEDES